METAIRLIGAVFMTMLIWMVLVPLAIRTIRTIDWDAVLRFAFIAGAVIALGLIVSQCPSSDRECRESGRALYC